MRASFGASGPLVETCENPSWARRSRALRYYPALDAKQTGPRCCAHSPPCGASPAATLISRQAHGFRNLHNYRLSVKPLCG